MAGERHRTGLAGEALAERHLRAAGYDILARRFRTRRGEIDLIAARDTVVAFVEVKTRRKGGPGPCGDALDAIGRRKQQRIVAAAEAFLASHREWSVAILRFDVIVVTFRDEPEGVAGLEILEHLEGAFGP